MSLAATIENAEAVRYRVTGMDCPSCAAKIEKAVRSAGVEDMKISTATQILTLHADAAQLPDVERAVTGIGYHLDRLDPFEAGAGGSAEPQKDQAHLNPAYKRALWIVVLLNLGYGAIEIVGGFLSGSQALKADALDFFGDGIITLLGLLAISWSMLWRARSALAQGLFLGALGLGVFAATVYRLLVLNQPEAELMGIFGAVALAINLLSALVLIPHRAGDANVRAVWLFSRNDAVGNAAVVVAAGLVALTGTAWPDLAVAFVIAGLFLHSAWVIVRDARIDLREAV